MIKLSINLFIALIFTGSVVQSQSVTGTGKVYVCPPCNCANDDDIFHEAGTCPGCGMSLMDKNAPDVAQRDVAIFLYEDVEILDFSGPGEVFAATRINGQAPFNVFTVAATKDPIISQGFVKIIPEYDINDAPIADIIVLPGGNTGPSQRNPEVIEWIKKHENQAEIIMSVCTGAFLIGEAGLLEGMTITTWWGQIENLKKSYPKSTVMENTRFVDNGKVLTTAGVSAGIDGALHVVSRLFDEKTAKATARYMEYDKWKPEDGFVTVKE